MSGPTQLPVIELEGAADAPVLVFDEVSVFGVMPGTGRVTLAVYLQDDDGNGGVKQRRRVVAHLRGNSIAFEALRNAINGMEAMLAPAPEGQKPN
jgi:hypothetical protein